MHFALHYPNIIMFMRYAHFFLNFQSFFDSELKSGKLNQISRDEIVSNCRCDLPIPEFLFMTNMVVRNSLVYKVGYVIQTGRNKDETPEFALITNIFVHEKNIFLGCQSLIVLVHIFMQLVLKKKILNLLNQLIRFILDHRISFVVLKTIM